MNKNVKMVAVVLALLFAGTVAYTGQTITATGWNQPAVYNMVSRIHTIANETKADFNLLEAAASYYNCGPVHRWNTTTGAATADITATGAANDVVMVTLEACINGVAKYINATTEVHAFKSAATLETGEACFYLISTTGASTTTLAVTQGTEVDATTETAVMPTCPASSAPLACIHIKSTNAPFIPNSTNWNASGVTTTVYLLRGPLSTGASAPTQVSATDVTFVDQ